MSDWYQRAGELAATGLYNPADEHDACGVGLIAAIDGVPRREIVERGIEGLRNMWHRGAVDADGKTGDGAGIHIQLPQTFFADYIARIGKQPDARLAVGMVFLPKKNFAAQELCRGIIETEILRLGYGIHGWRQVPVVAEVIGDIANESRPEIEQVIIAGRPELTEAQVERDLYLIRRRIENAVRARAINDFYICSLSSRSIIYKGLFKAEQLTAFYPDLLDNRFISNFAVFHQRFSTNTAPAWHLAQPFRVLAHNGEINTLRGNVNFMRSHEGTFTCDAFKGVEADLVPVIPDNTSDTGALDAVMEILTRAGRALPLAKLILIPPAWSKNKELPQHHRDLFACCNAVSEQWDGPAAIAATDGEWAVAGMDRHGLRPMRYLITRDGLLICASESGMIQVEEEQVIERGRLGPGEMIGVNLLHKKLYHDYELKDHLAAEKPYGEWVNKTIMLREVLQKHRSKITSVLPPEILLQRQLAAGITMEFVENIIHPMALTGKEAIGSMGDDVPIAVLSREVRPFHHYFRQNFSQVTNPPIDSLREKRVMSLKTRFGNDGNFLALDNSHSEIVLADTPILLAQELDAIAQHFKKRITKIDTVFDLNASGNALRQGLERIVREAESAALAGKSFLLLSDEAVDQTHATIPMILAISAVNSHLVKKKLRKKASILVRSNECNDVHALAVMIGSGATVVHPALVEEITLNRHARGLLGEIKREEALENLREALSQGLLKIMSKMGISVVSAYRGGLNFEAIGLSRALVAEFFPGLPSRISGTGLNGIESRVRRLHEMAHPKNAAAVTALPVGGFYRQRIGSEDHAWSGENIHALQTAVTKNSYALYKKYSASVHSRAPIALRDLLDFPSNVTPISLEEVEPVVTIRKRFIAPAMSLGALSPEAHETLAMAMNLIGAASNSGEGGEGPERYTPRANGDNANSIIKQVASGRFGVTAEYLNSARELQIKVAQGAKPGEGGQLPGFKVTTEIARLRHATQGVSLISPPPHHDIYSIEDLAQLIYDLKQINPAAIVSVKLVAQAGIGTIASGVAKAMADKIVISGHVGGTGASAWSSIKHAGVPWEMGLAEANQVLTLNRLRHRVVLQTDGGLKTGRDIVIAAILGAEEYALGTASLVAMGCLMVRQCHSNTCPVGITTQNEMLRNKFEGTVEKVVNLMSFVAEEVREILASLGARSLNEIIGRTELLNQVNRGSEDMVDLDLNTLLTQADVGPHARYNTIPRNEVAETLDAEMLEPVREALNRGEKIQLAYTVRNTMRAIGTRLSSLVVQSGGAQYPDQIALQLRGSAGQSLGAFLAAGIRIELYGEANDYVGKGLSGGSIIVRQRPSSTLVPHANTIIGNTVLYGATSGSLFASGQAGERFAVRNSGADAVVEGCGSNGCEYMTGGTVVILGEVGQNFAAGMTGGMAYIYDASSKFTPRLNTETVMANRLASQHWESKLHAMITMHYNETGSPQAHAILNAWESEKQYFWQICPKEMVERLNHPLCDEVPPLQRQA